MRWLGNLIGILKDEIALFEEVIGVLQEERKAVVENDLNGIFATNKKKENLSARQKLLDEALASCLKKAGKEGYTLSQLMEELAPSERSKLEGVVSRLQDVLDRLSWENKRNMFLINKAMEINQDLIRLFSPAYSLSYKPDGSLHTDFTSRLQIRG